MARQKIPQHVHAVRCLRLIELKHGPLEEPHRLKSVDDRLRQASVQVIDLHDHPSHMTKLLICEQPREVVAELV